MVCPGCGVEVAREASSCACGVHWIGKPHFESAQPVARLYRPIMAWSALAILFVVQAVVMIRALYFTSYRWPVELERTAFYLARFLLPGAAAAAFFARRGWRAARRDPEAFGGGRLALSAYLVSLGLLIIYSSVAVLHIPRGLENRRIRRMAQTQANMYRLAGMIEAYRKQYATYPRNLIDLQEFDPSFGPILDDWDHEFIYSAISTQVASRGTVLPFKGFDLVSRGFDGILGTEDDVVLRYDELSTPSGLATGATPAARAPHGRDR